MDRLVPILNLALEPDRQLPSGHEVHGYAGTAVD